ncbi:MAG: hypothetical protein K6U03_04935, partial [Firmicutes bacterium]|nr:hypothetical protein [Bacillota bacterium]
NSFARYSSRFVAVFPGSYAGWFTDSGYSLDTQGTGIVFEPRLARRPFFVFDRSWIGSGAGV